MRILWDYQQGINQ